MKSAKNIITLLGIVLIAALGYYLYTQNSSLDTSGQSEVVRQASMEAAVFRDRLNDIKSIQIDSAVFMDPKFQSLQDFSPAPVSLPVGTQNPFTISN